MFDPIEFANLAYQLCEDNEYASLTARARTAYGRAYYALMLAVRVAIRLAEKKSPDLKIPYHGDLWRVLEDSGVPKLQGLGKRLKDFYEAREKADYHVDPPEPRWVKDLGDPRFARANAEVAQDIIGRLPTYDFTPILGKL
jgi:hypothetical protein